jgi:hypothetical protein
MTRAEAEAEVRRLAAGHPDRATHRFFAREADGGWQVVRIPVPPGTRVDPLKATIEAKPKPSPADDPRSVPARNMPGTGQG